MKQDKDKKTLNEMGLGMGSLAAGVGEFGEDDLDLGSPGGMDDDLGMGMDDDLGDLDDGLDEGEELSISKDMLRDVLDAVEMGEKSAEEALDELCASCDEDMGMDDDLGDLDDDLAGMGAMDELSEAGYLEDIQRIANLLTDDPDIIKTL